MTFESSRQAQAAFPATARTMEDPRCDSLPAAPKRRMSAFLFGPGLLFVLLSLLAVIALKGYLSYSRLYAAEEYTEAALNAVSSGSVAGYQPVSVLPYDYRWFGIIGMQLPRQLTTLTFKGQLDSHERLLVFDQDVDRLLSTQSIESISLSFTYVSDKAISRLAYYEGLRELRAANTDISSRCVPDLMRMKWLQELDISGTSLSQQEIAAIKNALPECKVISDPSR